MDQKVIGEKVRQLRTKMGLTTITLAKKVRLSQAQVSRLENGLQGFRSATLVKFARALGVPPIYFFVKGEDTSTSKVAEELEDYGLTASRNLRKALANAAFLRFAEKCAKAFKAHKKNLVRMEAAVKRVT
jgi:transcriptional regulator with XRE-family HTH domain